MKTKTTWVNCTIWKKEGSNLRIADYLKKGTLVDLTGTPFSKAYTHEDGSVRSEIRLNVSNTNILRTSAKEAQTGNGVDAEDERSSDSVEDYSVQEGDF